MLAQGKSPLVRGALGPLTRPRKGAGQEAGRPPLPGRADRRSFYKGSGSGSTQPPREPGARFRVVWCSGPSAHTGVSGSPGSQSGYR